jgi:hypothetical protein
LRATQHKHTTDKNANRCHLIPRAVQDDGAKSASTLCISGENGASDNKRSGIKHENKCKCKTKKRRGHMGEDDI